MGKTFMEVQNKSPNQNKVSSNPRRLHFVSDNAAFQMLSLNKFLPQPEDKVLALKKISSLTGYSEKCQLLFNYTLSFAAVQCQYVLYPSHTHTHKKHMSL